MFTSHLLIKNKVFKKDPFYSEALQLYTNEEITYNQYNYNKVSTVNLLTLLESKLFDIKIYYNEITMRIMFIIHKGF